MTHNNNNNTGTNNHLVSIEVKDLRKTFGKGDISVKAVDDVSFHVANNEIVFFMGPSGAGKTTLVQMIGALLTPTSGTIAYGNLDMTQKVSSSKLTKFRLNNIGFIFQFPNLIANLTALQNIEIILNLNGIKGKKARKRGIELLRELKIDHRKDHKPDSLSGGEQQRVAIARALANDPKVIIADEPTASLDSKNGQIVMDLLRKIAKEKEKTVIIVTHDFRIKDYADRILWLEDGKIGLRWSIGEVIDPVCFMVLDDVTTREQYSYNSINYEFCSLDCKHRFELNPEFFSKNIQVKPM